MILRTQFKGMEPFVNVSGRWFIVYQAKRIPLLKFPRMSLAYLCGAKNCLLACNLACNRVRIVHYQIVDVHK